MKICCTDMNFKDFEVYLGPDKFSKKFPGTELLEADEEAGVVIYRPDPHYAPKRLATERNFKVYIVRTT